MNKILDLRFVIGVFFTIVGLLLLVYSFTSSAETSQSINQWCGIVFAAFGVFMMILSFRKDAADELTDTGH
jgi:uncharacterized membrane protein